MAYNGRRNCNSCTWFSNNTTFGELTTNKRTISYDGKERHLANSNEAGPRGSTTFVNSVRYGQRPHAHNRNDFYRTQLPRNSRGLYHNQTFTTNRRFCQRQGPMQYHHIRRPENGREISKLPDSVANLANLLVRFFQIKHHLANWATTPRTLTKSTEIWIKNLCPPNKTEVLTEVYEKARFEFLDSITAATTQHLEDGLATIIDLLKATDPDIDIDLATTTAIHRIRIKFNRAIHITKITGWLDEGIHYIGRTVGNQKVNPPVGWFRPRQTIPRTRPTNADIPSLLSLNRFAVLADEANDTETSERDDAPNSNGVDPGIKDGTNNRSRRNSTDQAGRMETMPPRQPSEQDWADRYTAYARTHNCQISKARIPKTRLQPSTIDRPILIAGDSNMRAWHDYPDDWSVLRYPGIRLEQMSSMIERSVDLLQEVDYILLAAGTNNLDDPLENLISAVETVKRTKEILGKRLLVVGTLSSDLSDIMPERRRVNAERLNSMLRDVVGAEDFIEPPPNDTTTFFDAVHYTKSTGLMLIDCVKAFLEAL